MASDCVFSTTHSINRNGLTPPLVPLDGNDTWSNPAALVWGAHIGFDRMLGYWLKYETAFTDTHLGRVGRVARTSRASLTKEDR